jgi:hypothetical protein
MKLKGEFRSKPIEGTGGDEKRPPIMESHSGRHTLKSTTALETSSLNKGTAGEQHEAKPTRKEGWTPLEREEVSTTA